MDVSYTGTQCGSVLDASQSVLAIPWGQKEPPKINICILAVLTPDLFIHAPFLPKKYSPDDEFVFTGQVGRLCHFDVTTCGEARRLDN